MSPSPSEDIKNRAAIGGEFRTFLTAINMSRETSTLTPPTLRRPCRPPRGPSSSELAALPNDIFSIQSQPKTQTGKNAPSFSRSSKNATAVENLRTLGNASRSLSLSNQSPSPQLSASTISEKRSGSSRSPKICGRRAGSSRCNRIKRQREFEGEI